MYGNDHAQYGQNKVIKILMDVLYVIIKLRLPYGSRTAVPISQYQ